jgi:hypothetical protein
LAELHEEIEQLELSTAYTAYASTQVSSVKGLVSAMALGCGRPYTMSAALLHQCAQVLEEAHHMADYSLLNGACCVCIQ